MAAYRAVLLDVLGTLVELEAPWPVFRRILVERHGIDVPEEDARRALLEEMRFYRAHHIEGSDPEALESLRLRCADVLRTELPAIAGVPVEDVKEALLDSLRFVPYPDAAEPLAELREDGVRLAAVSNWDCSLRGVLAGLGLGAALDAVVVSAEVRAAKPDPSIFRSALGAVRAAPEQALFVGDSPETDVEGARRAGLRALLLVRSSAPEHAGDPDTIFSLAELPELIRAGG